MKLTVLTGNIMRCNSMKILGGISGAKRLNEETGTWDYVPDEVLKTTVFLKMSETEYIDIDEVKSMIGVIGKMLDKDTLGTSPGWVGDYYVDAKSLKPYFEQAQVEISVQQLKQEMCEAEEKIAKLQYMTTEQEKTSIEESQRLVK